MSESEVIEENCGATNMVTLESHKVESKYVDGKENSSVIGEAKNTVLLQASTDALSFNVGSSAVE